MVPVGRDVPLTVPIDHGGPNVLELEVAPGPHELTLDNNRAVVVVNGVRDRLRVLLVSGEPHAGERVWRNILKSDPSVDLVHFTILRPPEKQDGTPIRELSLIAFPIRELFDAKLDEFDLIIFDRYSAARRDPAGLSRKRRALRAQWRRLARSGRPQLRHADEPVSHAARRDLAGRADRRGLRGGFKPQLTELGRRHPVTADLPGAGPPGGSAELGTLVSPGRCAGPVAA